MPVLYKDIKRNTYTFYECLTANSIYFKTYISNYCLFHEIGAKSINIGKISSRPANISNIKINFEKSENIPKLRVGPTSSNPGPILFNVAATAVKLVVKSKLSMPISKIENAKINMYATIKIFVKRTVSCSIGRLSIVIFLTPRG